MIPYGRKEITQQDVESVVSVLTSDFLTQGPQVPLFEKKVKATVKANYAVAVNSATSALHIACLALGVGPGDMVWTTPITFVASANCAIYCGAKIDFVDIDSKSYNLSTEKLQQKLEHAVNNGLTLPKVVVPVHLSGQACEMKKIHALSITYGFNIIEDASHAIGGKYQNAFIGNCQYSDITIFSFHPVKIITSAEGGVATTNSTELANRMALLRSHGITKDTEQMTEASHGNWYYQQIALGFNYRMTEMQAALGSSQITRLHHYVKQRNELALRYDEKLQHMALILPEQARDTYSARHLYIIKLKLDRITLSHKDFFQQLQAKGIGVNLHYIPVHIEPYFQQLGFVKGQFPVAEQYYETAISIPLFHTMTIEQQDYVIDVIHRTLAL